MRTALAHSVLDKIEAPTTEKFPPRYTIGDDMAVWKCYTCGEKISTVRDEEHGTSVWTGMATKRRRVCDMCLYLVLRELPKKVVVDAVQAVRKSRQGDSA